MQTPLIPDQDIRDRAIDPTQSFTVRAPAGSGKTELLIARIIKLLEVVEDPKNILAITFTRKASEEMRTRLCKKLFIDLPDHPIHARAKKLGWLWDPQIAPCQIMTIDAWIQSWLPLHYTLHPMHDWLYEEAVKLWLDLHRQSQAFHTLLQAFGGSMHRCIQWIHGALAQRDLWLVDVLDPTPWSTRMMTRQNDRLTAWQKELSKLLHPDVVCLEKILASLPPTIPKKLPSPGDHEAWQYFARFLYTKEGNIRKRMTQDQGFLAGKNLTEKKLLLDLTNNWPDRVHTLWRYMQGAICPQDPLTLDAIQCILHDVLGCLHLIFDTYNACDFTQYMLEALQSIEAYKDSLPTEHILLDESQDTSYSQIQLIKKLTQGWHNPHHTIFMVGDPMQSIYRFRHADVREFMRILENGFKHHPLIPLTLSTNFRQNKSLVDFTNELFTKIFPSEPSLEEGAIPFTASIGLKKDPGHVHALLWQHDDVTDPSAYDVTYVETLHQNTDPDESIGLLVRTRARLYPFIHKDITYPIHTVDVIDAQQHPILRDALELLTLMMHPMDVHSWQHILRSPWVGLSLKDLFTLGKNSSLPEALQHYPHLSDPVSEKNLYWFLDSYTSFTTLSAPFTTCYLQWLEALGLLKQLETGACTTLTHILEHISIWQPRLGTLPRYYLHALFTSTRVSHIPPGSRITSMSIHKSKGLEFDHVYLPLIDKPSRPLRSEAIVITPSFVEDATECLVWHKPSQELSHTPWLTKLLTAQEHYENMRLLYVACTRAKKSLYFSATKIQHWAALIPNWQNTTITTIYNNRHTPHIPRRIIHENYPPLQTPPTQDLLPQDPQHFGILVHAILHQAWRIGPHRWLQSTQDHPYYKKTTAYTWLKTYANIHAMPPHILGTVWPYMLRTLSYPNVCDVLKKRPVFCHAEYVVYAHDTRYVIDRIYEEHGIITLIDYKTSPPTEENKEIYRKKLDTYRDIIHNVYPDHKIHHGILWLTTGTFDWL